jgi:hypothetical protein
MELYELNLSQYLEVKLLRLNKLKFNSTLLPFTGAYNSLEDLKSISPEISMLTDPNTSCFEKTFQEFSLNENSSVGIDNMFTLSSSFGKVLFCENLEALLIINNTSDKEVKIKDFKVRISNEVLEGYDSMFRKTEYTLINSQNSIIIPGNSFFNQKLRINADIMCKYSLEIDVQYTNQNFYDEYVKHSANKIIKTISSQYSIENNSTAVIRKYYKKFLFATNLPFKIKEKFVNDNMEKCYVEINLINQCPYTLHIDEVLLLPDGDKSGMDRRESLSNTGFISCVASNEMKNFNIEPDEEINIVFVLNSYKTTISCVRLIFNLTLKITNFIQSNLILGKLCF